MKFGVREICDVVLRAKAAQKIGNKVFYKNEPVLYFDSLKTSTMEGAATTVYAQGGRGNARLIAWEGERTVTFTMEDALISAMGFSVLTGAGLVDAKEKSVIAHVTEQIELTSENIKEDSIEIGLKNAPYLGKGNHKTWIEANDGGYYKTNHEFVKVTDKNEDDLENYFTKEGTAYEKATTYDDSNTTIYYRYSDNEYVPTTSIPTAPNNRTKYKETDVKTDDNTDYIYVMVLDDNGEIVSEPYIAVEDSSAIDNKTIKIMATESDGNRSDRYRYGDINKDNNRKNDLSKFEAGTVVLVDYYVEKTSGAYQIDITPDKFGGNFYLEASTLFRATNGVDMPAEFIIPNCKIQSNFTFTMASSGDPSTFTFTMDAFPDYTRWDRTKKVYAAIQVIEESDTLSDFERLGTPHDKNDIVDLYNAEQKDWIEKD